MDIASALSHSGLFKELSAEHLRALAERSFARHVPKREVLFLQGDEGHSVYLLLSGQVQLHKNAPDGSQTVIKVVGPGEIFAEVVLFEQRSYPVTATALADSHIILIPRKGINDLLAEERFRNDFIAMLLKKQRYLAERIYYLTQCDIEERFFRFVHEHYGSETKVTIPLSRKDIAAAIGATPESLSRLVQKLEEAGKIKWRGKELELLAGAEAAG
jgi:CRP/FNR family transcriptional regulator, dissimilatory nitrate respiration regulator